MLWNTHPVLWVREASWRKECLRNWRDSRSLADDGGRVGTRRTCVWDGCVAPPENDYLEGAACMVHTCRMEKGCDEGISQAREASGHQKCVTQLDNKLEIINL